MGRGATRNERVKPERRRGRKNKKINDKKQAMGLGYRFCRVPLLDGDKSEGHFIAFF